MEKTAELQIKHAIEQAKHIKETVFKFTCHVPNIGELKKSSCLFLQSCYLFYIRQWAMSVPVQNKVVKSILYLETIHSLCLCGIPFLTLWPQIWRTVTHIGSGYRYSWGPVSNVLGFCGVCNTYAGLFFPVFLSFTFYLSPSQHFTPLYTWISSTQKGKW